MDKPPTMGLRPNRSFISQKSFGSGSRPSLVIRLLMKSIKDIYDSLRPTLVSGLDKIVTVGIWQQG